MGQARILMYHHLALEPRGPWEVSPRQLKQHLNGLRRQGFRLGTLGDVLRGEEVVVPTFDDGYLSVFEHAYPLLSEMGVTATVFVPVHHVGGTNSYDCLASDGPRRAARLLTWRHLAELSGAGWCVESHGCSHLPLDLLLEEHVEDEVRRSKGEIEDRLGNEVSAFAYPFGIPPDPSRVPMEAVLAEAGYRAAVLAWGGPVPLPPSDPYRIARMPAAGEGEDLVESSAAAPAPGALG